MPKISKLITLLAIFVWAVFSATAIAAVPAIHFGADWRPMDVKSCAVKAIDAMRAQDFTEGTREAASAWGFNQQSVVLVRWTPQNNGVFIEVMAVSRGNAEAERLRNQIRISVFDARRPDLRVLQPDHFNNDSGAFGGPRRVRNHPPVHWGFDTRVKSLKTCMSGAKHAMYKSGLQSAPNGNSLMWGTSGNATALVSCVPISRGVSILVAATSENGALAEKLRNDIRKVTFDSVAFD
jgi:hypothetical protein